MKIKALTAKFSDLFDSEESAVICYLSLEREFKKQVQYFKKWKEDMKCSECPHAENNRKGTVRKCIER